MVGSEENINQTTAGNGWFKTTHWSVVLAAGGNDSAQSHAALTALCQAYWYPLYSYIRRSGHGPEDAEDLTQGFFSRLIEKDFLKGITKVKAKFRSFLLMSLKRFLANERDRANCLKRGGGCKVFSLNLEETEVAYQAEAVDEMSPERAFERRWAVTLLDRVLAGLEAESCATGKRRVFDHLKELLGRDETQRSYAEIGQTLEMSEGAVKASVHRLRRRYRELLRLEIANTVQSPEEINDEIRHLFATFSR